jgi:hypothetical protein
MAMIQAGDMAMWVWGCCAVARRYVGTVVRVDAIGIDNAFCPRCGHTTTQGNLALIVCDAGHGPVPVSWLIKIPPPGDKVETRSAEEVSA